MSKQWGHGYHRGLEDAGLSLGSLNLSDKLLNREVSNLPLTFYCYRIPSIAYGWEYMDTVTSFARKVSMYEGKIACESVLDLFDSLVKRFFFSCVWWKGEFTEQPAVFPIRFKDRYLYGFTFKYSKPPGVCIMSPIALDEDAFIAFIEGFYQEFEVKLKISLPRQEYLSIERLFSGRECSDLI